MPRYLPLMADQLQTDFSKLSSFLQRLEVNYATVQVPQSRITLSGLELAYELCYLKAFLLWEVFQEQVFLRLLCGFHSNGGGEPRIAGAPYFRNINLANAAVLGGRDYRLWHNPLGVVRISDQFFTPASYFRQTIQINRVALERYAAVRHRIAHAQNHAEAQFDVATMGLAGRRYPASSAGRFLRDHRAGQAERWMTYITNDLVSVAHQFC
jgi:hypothetical protein